MKHFALKALVVAAVAFSFSTAVKAGGYGHYGYGDSYYSDYDDHYYKKKYYKKKKRTYYKKRHHKKKIEKKVINEQPVFRDERREPVVQEERRRPVAEEQRREPVVQESRQSDVIEEKQPVTKGASRQQGAVVAAAEKVVQSEKVLSDKKGMTLYTFDKDKVGISNCYADCATSWPPYFVEQNAVAKENFTIVLRKDGKQQWAYKGQPVYYWAGDQKPGDKTGDDVGGVWHIIKL